MARPPSYRDVIQGVELGPRGKRKKRPKTEVTTDGVRRFWWMAEKNSDEEAMLLTATVNALAEQNTELELAHLRWHRLYEGIHNMQGMLGYTAAAATFLSSHSLRMVGAGPAYNVIESCCDTATAKIGSDVARPLCRTTGGDYKMQRKAKDLNRFIRGMFKQVDADHLATRCFLEGCVEGTGVLHVYDDDSEIKMDLVIANDLLVDAADAYQGKPRSIYRRQYVQRELLLAAYGTTDEMRQKINDLPRDELGWKQQQVDLVLLVEAHHLPSKRDGTDGRHTIACGNVNFSSEPWKRQSFPYAIFRWKERRGFWGKGIAEQLLALQVEINRVLLTISQSHKLVGVPSVWVEQGSKINKAHLNNEIGHIGTYKGTPPTFMTPAPVNVQVNEYLESLYAKAYQLMGISEMSSQGIKPAGLNSEPGMEAYRNIEDERFSDKEQARDRLIVDVAELLIEQAIDIYERGDDVVVRMEDGAWTEEVSWGDISLKRDEYTIEIEPVSKLPDELSGRLDMLQQFTQLQVFTPSMSLAFLELGDMTPATKLITAGLEDVLQCLAMIVEDGDYTQPSPQMDLDLAINWGNAAYLLARDRRAKVPEERQDMLLQFVEDAQYWKQQATPPPAPAGPPGPGGHAPLARGPQLPVNQMMPAGPPA